MRILVADDEAGLVDIMRNYLEGKGLVVDCALDGKSALRLIKEQDYDIVFLDINMPELTGVEVLRFIKDNHIRAKVVFLTGYPYIDENLARLLRADEYLEKPISLKAIEEVITKYTPS